MLAAQELYSSIAQALQERGGEGSEREYVDHLPAEILEAGIKSGRFLQVGVMERAGVRLKSRSRFRRRRDPNLGVLISWEQW